MDDISALQHTLANWDRLGYLAAALVFLGAVLVALTQFEGLTRWSGLERIPRWHWPIGKLGALLVLAALAGEIVAFATSRNVNDQITAKLAQEAAATNERARSLERDAAELRLQLARLKWRVVTPDQQATLTAMLQAAPKGPVVVLHGPDDEPNSYARQISDALRAAGFDSRVQQAPATLNVPGMWLLVRDIEHPPAHALPIQNAFREIHVDLDGQQDTQIVPDTKTVIILIGPRRF